MGMETVSGRIQTTSQAFENGVWPIISAAIGGGVIIPVENTSDKDFLDTHAGIDHWHVTGQRYKSIRGIASRCQWRFKHVFQTFTVRVGRKDLNSTELARRMYAYENRDKGLVRPYLFIQAWFEPPRGSFDKFICAGVAKMDDILEIIRDGKEGVDWRRQVTKTEWGQSDSNEFIVIDFETVKSKGYSFKFIEDKHDP
jgi:hypothetical protein